MPRAHLPISQGDPTPATTPQCWQVWGLMVGARESGGWAPQVLQQALSGCCEAWGQAGAGAGLSAALAGKLVSTRVWVCGRVCVRDYIFYIMLTEGSLTGLGDLCNWERATEHLWARVLICWGGDRARRSCGACTEHVSLAGLNPTFWDGRQWTGIKSSLERQGLALLELVETRVHTCVQGVILSRGWTWEGNVKGQVGCPSVPPAPGVNCMLCPVHASRMEQICLIWVRRLFSPACRYAGTA